MKSIVNHVIYKISITNCMLKCRSSFIKQTVVCVALLGAASVSYAQSSITLYGAMDMGVNYRTAAGASGGKPASAWNLGSNEITNRWGLLGSEDIGGGVKVTFRIESGFNPSNGTGNFSVPYPADNGSLFDRGATVGIVSKYGSLLFGRNWSPLIDAFSVSDTTGYMNFGSLSNATFQNSSNINPALGPSAIATGQNSPINGGLLYTWVNNSAKYMLPDNFFSGGALYSLGGTPGSFQSKSAVAGNLNWTNGQLGLQSAYFDQNDPSGLTDKPWLRAWTVGVTYTIGQVKSGFTFVKYRNPTTGANQNYYYVSSSWQATPALRLTGDWMHLQDRHNTRAGADLYKIGANYFLSKRSALYVDVAYSDNRPEGTLGAGANISLLTSPATIGHNQLAVAAGVKTYF